jgi:outer membrane protein assembly factor BamA
MIPALKIKTGDIKTANGVYTTTICLCFMILMSTAVAAQDSTNKEKPCEPKDLVDYARDLFNLKKKTKEKNSSFFIAPVFGSTPSTGFVYGITFQGAFELSNCKMSAFQSNIQYTTKQQFTISIKNNVFAKDNRIFLSGDWSYMDYSQPTYGLGTSAPKGSLPDYFYFQNVGEPTDSLVQPMRYKYLKLHQTISWSSKKNFFIGTGFHLDYYTDIKDEKLDTPVHYITSHYAYSKKYGFNPGKYTVVGVSLNFVYDTRDNMVNAYKGIYANINYRVNPEFLGSDKTSTTLWTEFRTYVGVSKKRPEKLFAFWYVGHFTMGGDIPYLNLPFLGNDQRQKTGRGYTLGRYRGNNMVYGEVEYRFPISKCTKFFSGVIFANAVTTNNKDAGTGLFEYVQPGFGAGIRILFAKLTRMNIQIDYGKGNRSGGVYFGASEVF